MNDRENDFLISKAEEIMAPDKKQIPNIKGIFFMKVVLWGEGRLINI